MSVNYYNLMISGLEDFEGYILPDVFDELRFGGVSGMPGIICIGAADEIGPLGAIVVNLGEELEAEIASIYVEPNARMKGIGRTLLSRALSEILFILEDMSAVDDPNLNVTLHIDYCLPKEDYDGFKKFLSSTGFTFNDDIGNSYFLPSNCFDNLEDGSTVSHSINNDIGVDNWDDAASLSGIELDPELCFYAGNSDSPDLVLLTQYGYDEDYYFITDSPNEKVDENALLSLVNTAVSKLKKKHDNFTIILNDQFNVESPLWGELAGRGGETYLHGESFMPAAFLSKGGSVNA